MTTAVRAWPATVALDVEQRLPEPLRPSSCPAGRHRQQQRRLLVADAPTARPRTPATWDAVRGTPLGARSVVQQPSGPADVEPGAAHQARPAAPRHRIDVLGGVLQPGGDEAASPSSISRGRLPSNTAAHIGALRGRGPVCTADDLRVRPRCHRRAADRAPPARASREPELGARRGDDSALGQPDAAHGLQPALPGGRGFAGSSPFIGDAAGRWSADGRSRRTVARPGPVDDVGYESAPAADASLAAPIATLTVTVVETTCPDPRRHGRFALTTA